MSTTNIEPTRTDTPAPATADVTLPPAPDVAADGSKEAFRLGGLKIGYDTLFTTVPIYLALILLWLFFDRVTNGDFISSRNISDMFQEYSYKPVLALGVVFVLLLGEIDLSLGYLTLLSITVAAVLLQHNWPSGAAILGAILACTALGLAQGFLIAWVRMPAFVVTLGGFLIFEGGSLFILAGSSIPISDASVQNIGSYYLPSWLGLAGALVALALYVLYRLNDRRVRARASLSNSSLAQFAVATVLMAAALIGVVLFLNNYQGVPLPLVILLACAVVLWFMARRTRFGRHIYAVGGNLEAARRAGIDTTAIRWIVFGISGLMAGVAGIMLAGYGHTASPNAAGPDLLLDVISIAVIGGVSLTGGRGSVWAVLLGGLVIASVDSGLNLLGTIDPSTVYIIKGGILLLAILVDVVGKRRGGLAVRR
jgi:D-xylose transport system permease protein